MFPRNTLHIDEYRPSRNDVSGWGGVTRALSYPRYIIVELRVAICFT